MIENKSGAATLVGVFTAALATACGGGLSDNRYPTGSGAMTTSSDYRALYVANTDHGAVTRFDVASNATVRVDVGSEPTRIARANSKVFVSLRGERKVAVLEETDNGLKMLQTIEVGAEPYGVVATENGEHVYVAVSLANKVVEIDVEAMEISNEWDVQDQPRWLALHPDGTLYVGSGMNGTFTYIRKGEATVANLPRINRGAGDFEVRIMGDMAVSSDGYYVAVPTMNLDPVTPIDDTGSIPAVGYYGGRSDSTVVLIPAEGGEPDMSGSRVIALSDGTQSQPLGYASSVTFDPKGFKLYANIEGGEAVAVIDIEGEKGASGGLLSEVFSSDPTINGIRFAETLPLGFVKAPEGPRSVVFTENEQAFVYGFIDRAVAKLDTSPVAQSEDPTNFVLKLIPPLVGEEIQIAGPAFSPEIEDGRRIFYATNIKSVSSPLSGLSCNTCHFDSRNDGLSWTFTRGQRQTPSLAGPVSMTAPVRWQGDRETVAVDAQRTSRDAMGGADMSDRQAELVAAYVDFTRDVDVPLATSSNPGIARGQAIFSREDVGCAGCHNGPRMTDNQSYEMFGMNGVQTRSLIGLAASAPYLHDGSARSVRDVLQRSRTGQMGNTSSLSEAEMDDLELFLLSL